MNEQPFSEVEWQGLHDEIQKRLYVLAEEVRATIRSIEPRFGKTVTKRFPLFSYVGFKWSPSDDDEHILVGVDIGPHDGQWRIDADVCGEESGTVYFELPNPFFAVASFEEMRNRVLAATDQLLAGGRPVLLRLLASLAAPSRPSSVPSAASQSPGMPEVAAKELH